MHGGELNRWMGIMKDIPVSVLETWTREDVEHNRNDLDGYRDIEKNEENI